MLNLNMVTFHWNSKCDVQSDVSGSEGGHHQAENPKNKPIRETVKTF